MLVITSHSNRDEFEDVLFNPDLVVVQKDYTDSLSHLTSVYVYANQGDKNPISGFFREITGEGTDFWKEEYEA
jgi:hypothetical protein